jgi:FtsZ-binding cell division protein ZapB
MHYCPPTNTIFTTIEGLKTEIERLKSSNEYLKKENTQLCRNHNEQVSIINGLKSELSAPKQITRPYDPAHNKIWKRIEDIEEFLQDRFYYKHDE